MLRTAHQRVCLHGPRAGGSLAFAPVDKKTIAMTDHANVFYVGRVGCCPADRGEGQVDLYKYGVSYRFPQRARAHRRRFGQFDPALLVVCDCNRQVEAAVKMLARSRNRAVPYLNSSEVIALDADPAAYTSKIDEAYTFAAFQEEVMRLVACESARLDLTVQRLLLLRTAPLQVSIPLENSRQS